jgi:hypothetical protein
MWRITNDKWQDNGDPSACPHCGAGEDRITVGLYWDFDESCWHCIICGCRVYEQVVCLMSEADIEAERVWDRICSDLDDVKSSQVIHHDRDQETTYLIHGIRSEQGGTYPDYLIKDFTL